MYACCCNRRLLSRQCSDVRYLCVPPGPLPQDRQEAREAAILELRQEKTAHAEQYRQLQTQLELAGRQKKEADREVGALRASLKGKIVSAVSLYRVSNPHLAACNYTIINPGYSPFSFHLCLSACEVEVSHLSEAVSQLTDQLCNEREEHGEVTRSLQAAAEEGRTQVSSTTHSIPTFLYILSQRHQRTLLAGLN